MFLLFGARSSCSAAIDYVRSKYVVDELHRDQVQVNLTIKIANKVQYVKRDGHIFYVEEVRLNSCTEKKLQFGIHDVHDFLVLSSKITTHDQFYPHTDKSKNSDNSQVAVAQQNGQVLLGCAGGCRVEGLGVQDIHLGHQVELAADIVQFLLKHFHNMAVYNVAEIALMLGRALASQQDLREDKLHSEVYLKFVFKNFAAYSIIEER